MNHLICFVCLVALCLAVSFSQSAMADDQPNAKTVEPAKAKAPTDEKPKLPDRVYVKMTTTMGEIIIELNAEKAPITVDNFLQYADVGFYNGTIFHRVINGFMIQGGGFDKDMNQRPMRPAIKNEWKNGLKNTIGTIAMARTSQPDSATSQFFINVANNRNLDMPQPGSGAAYAVFGKVIDGMDAVNEIKNVETHSVDGHKGVPVEPVEIYSVVRVEKEKIADLIAKAEAKEKELLAREEAAEKERQAKRAAAEKAQKEQKAAAEAKMFQNAMDFLKKNEVDTSKGVQTESGLWYVDVVEGTGASPKMTTVVSVHYTGWTTEGVKFDSSYDRGKPYPTKLTDVIAGWTEGVGGMKVGGTRWLVIPADLGYGQRGAGAKIKPGAMLIFKVELLEIK